MLRRRFFLCAGAATWVAGGVGHFVLVDALTLHGRTRVSELVPHGGLLAVMENTTLNFGRLGSTTVFLATAGFSVWVALSLSFLGLIYLMLARQESVMLQPFARLGVVISAAFLAVAALCFIYPAAIGGVLATMLFLMSWVRKES